MKKAVTKKQKARLEDLDQTKLHAAVEWLRQGKGAAATTRESDKFILRLPDGMREHLAEVAESQGRTMNAVVIGALAEYLADAKSLESQLAGIEKAILALTDKVAEQNEAVTQIVKENAEKGSVRRPGKG